MVRLAGMDEAVRGQRQEIAARPWRLSRPLHEYAGEYSNRSLGTIRVAVTADGRLGFRWGELRAVADGYDKQDVVRVELVPNSGELVSFMIDEGIVTSLSIGDIPFARN